MIDPKPYFFTLSFNSGGLVLFGCGIKNSQCDWLSFYACRIQIGCIECIECIERHMFWLAKPSGASHIWNSIHSPLYCMFHSSGMHHGQNSFKYLQNILLSFVIPIILEGHLCFEWCTSYAPIPHWLLTWLRASSTHQYTHFYVNLNNI